MKITKNLTLLGASLVLVACQQEKIGFVNNVKLMDAYQEKMDIEEKYQLRSEEFGKRRDSISQAFQQEAQAFQEEAQKMSQQRAQEAYGSLQQRGQMIGQQLQQEEQQLQRAGQTEMDSLISKVKSEIRKYGEAKGYAYILGGGDGGAVLYGDSAHDLTDEILAILNESYEAK